MGQALNNTRELSGTSTGGGVASPASDHGFKLVTAPSEQPTTELPSTGGGTPGVGPNCGGGLGPFRAYLELAAHSIPVGFDATPRLSARPLTCPAVAPAPASVAIGHF
jgi:hypothetical protein